jgi:hypothetical protein
MGTRTWTAAAAALACGAAMMSVPAAAYTSVNVQLAAPLPAYGVPVQYYVAPPPPRHENASPHRRGHIWVPGHWEWQRNSHAWVRGHYLPVRAGYYYEQPLWEQHGDRWSYRPGRWARGDRDHDGVPNRYDRDRDGDGVPNRFDRAPNNPYRR